MLKWFEYDLFEGQPIFFLLMICPKDMVIYKVGEFCLMMSVFLVQILPPMIWIMAFGVCVSISCGVRRGRVYHQYSTVLPHLDFLND